jgi:hypothetical protein
VSGVAVRGDAGRHRHAVRGEQRARDRFVKAAPGPGRRAGIAGHPVEQRGDGRLHARVAADGLGEVEGRIGTSPFEIGEQALGVAGHADGSHAPAERETRLLDPACDLAHAGDGEFVAIDPMREPAVVAGEHGDPARHASSGRARDSR